MRVGVGPRVRSVIELVPNILKSPEDKIRFKKPESVQEAKHLLELADWVGAHEVAHLVQRKQSEESSEILKKKSKGLNTLNQQIERRNNLHEVTLVYIAGEVMIDALGLHLIEHAGTSDIEIEDHAERLEKGFESYLRTIDFIITMHRESLPNYSNEDKQGFQVHTLRHIVVGQEYLKLLKEGSDEKRYNEFERFFNTATEELEKVIMELSDNSPVFTDTERGKIEKVYKEIFQNSYQMEIIVNNLDKTKKVSL